MNSFICPFCDTSINYDVDSYNTECIHFPMHESKVERIPYIVSNLKNITDQSIVYDIGGFTGIFTTCMVNTFNPKMVIFEPTKQYYNILKDKFKDADIHNFGFGADNRYETIYVDGQNTSVHPDWTNNATEEIIYLKNIVDYMESSHDIIDLMAINCEGGEYEILPALISSIHINNIKQLLVQFHNINEYSLDQVNLILNSLNKTHKCILDVGVWKWVLFELK